MKKTALFVFTMLFLIPALPVPSAHAAAVEPDGSEWRLIDQDQRGNALYVAPAALEDSAGDIRKIWLKFETPVDSSPSPMLFLNELDCAKGLIKRLEVKLYRATCAGSGRPLQTISFEEGRWDRPSEGIEMRASEAICGAGGI